MCCGANVARLLTLTSSHTQKLFTWSSVLPCVRVLDGWRGGGGAGREGVMATEEGGGGLLVGKGWGGGGPDQLDPPRGASDGDDGGFVVRVFGGRRGGRGGKMGGVVGGSPGPTQGPACYHFQGLDTTPVSQGFPAP